MSVTPSAARVAGVVLLAAAGGVQADSYLASEDERYYRVGLGYTFATRAWDEDGVSRDIGCRSQRSSFSHQVEYGYSYYYTLFGNASLSDVRCGDISEKQGIGDVTLGVRGRLNPFMNFRAWELALTVPTEVRSAGGDQVGCGAWGLSASVERTDTLSPWISAGYGAGVQLSEAPLSHQANAKGSLSGPIGLYTRWSWYGSLGAMAPLDDRSANLAPDVRDCGTRARAVASSAEVKYQLTREAAVGCGLQATVWGEDISRSSGFSCSFSHRWY